jgi:hypothetical protein
MPLDGLWARAPYLHNGSVPTLRDLLAKPPSDSEESRRARAGELLRGDEAQVAQEVELRVREARAKGERPLLFFRGNDLLDHDNVGFVVDRARTERRRHYLYDTTREGCHNTGHTYGTALSEAEKEQLISFLKTL